MENINLSYNKKILNELKRELSASKKDEKFV